jgi:two-component system, OmpR family, sensor histidine kinase KdpD
MNNASRIGLATGAGVAGAVLIARSRMASRGQPSRDPIHDLTRTLTRCDVIPDILAAIERSFTSATGFPCAIFIPEGDRLCARHHSSRFDPDDNDVANAGLSIKSGRPVAQLSGTPDLYSHFIPLTTSRDTLGSFGFRARGTRGRIPRRMWALAESFANQTSLAILRVTLEGKARHAEILAEAHRLQKALLNSIAHNVRTPLASIIGVLSTLQQEEISLSHPIRQDLIDTARQEAERLNRLLGNLLDLSRLEAGVLRIRKDPCDVQDLIGAALEQLGSAAGHRRVEVKIAPDVPFVPMDFVLIVQVLVNLLDNALKYSPDGPSITVEARVLSGVLEISVSDSGNGIAEDDLPHVFERFNRGCRGGETGGIGLGLSICRGLIDAHHGTIRAERRYPCGTVFAFTLPIQLER